VSTCTAAFDAVLGDRPNQLDKLRPDVNVTAADIINPGSTPGAVTLNGLRTNISVALRYLTAWVSEQGAVAIDNLMEDAATVEISRTQVWQWLHYKTKLAEGLVVTRKLVDELIDNEVAELHKQAKDERAHRHVDEAKDVFVEAALGDDLPGFFTPYAYVRYLIARPLQPTGPLSADDLRMSERVPREHQPA
jgi:malate synthase